MTRFVCLSHVPAAGLRVAGLSLHLIELNNRSACVYREEAYALGPHHLVDLSRKFRCAVPAYVLMSNHVHLQSVKAGQQKLWSVSCFPTLVGLLARACSRLFSFR